MSKTLNSEILDAIEILIQATVKKLAFDKTESGIIRAVNNDKTYDVEIRSKIYTLKYNGSKILKVNDRVYVLIPQNNYRNAFIL